MSGEEKEVRRVADQIRAYFAESPMAAESLEGIVRWWLLQQRFEEAWRNVSEALELLVQEGVLQRTVNAGGHVVYSLRKREDTEE